MEKIEKYPITSNEQMYKLGTYVTPIMDQYFNQKFANYKEPKKDVTIQYIFLGDLLAKRGQEMMRVLSDAKFLNIMTIPFIKYLVMYQWYSV